VSPLAVALLTYVGHYVFARLLYDEFVRPAALYGAGGWALVGALLALALLLRRRRRRRFR